MTSSSSVSWSRQSASPACLGAAFIRPRNWGARKCGSCGPNGTRRFTKPAGAFCGLARRSVVERQPSECFLRRRVRELLPEVAERLAPQQRPEIRVTVQPLGHERTVGRLIKHFLGPAHVAYG